MSFCWVLSFLHESGGLGDSLIIPYDSRYLQSKGLLAFGQAGMSQMVLACVCVCAFAS